jgi:glycolate oxidase FAD binding subunit
VSDDQISGLNAQLSETLARASANRQTIAIEGAGTKRGWGSVAPPADVTISTRALARVVEHRHADLTATVEAGAALADVNRELARHGQWIALDPPFSDRATIGGILATNDSGPRRHRYGAPRDQIIGVELVRVDGTIARSGGIVVKNVAGYDLGKLLAGSFGSLAVIASATFKLYPIPQASRTVLVGTATDIAPIVSALASSQLTPTAIELETGSAEGLHYGVRTRLLVRFESIAAAADQQAAHAATLAESRGGRATVIEGAEETALWDAHAQRPWSGAGAVLKVTLLPTDVSPALAALDESLRGVDWEAIGRASAGVLLVRVGGDVSEQQHAITTLRSRLQFGRGSVVVVRAADDLKRAVDVWGPAGDALPVMRAIKQQFDPDGLLNPGRGPFGI